MTGTASPTATALLAVMKLKGLGRRAALKIVDRPIDEADIDGCREVLRSRMPPACRARISLGEVSDAWAMAEEQLGQGGDIGVRAFSYHDEGYPQRLRKIPDPPAVLFVKGRTHGLHAARGLAVVGTREPTRYGEKVAGKSSRTAVEAGFVIVSGLAHGCDTHAHHACVDAHGVGVAVLAHGLDRVYPAVNRGLADRLLDEGGCLVSEYPIGMKPVRAAFAERDRIQSGLSDAVLVIETDIKGGTMHTVRSARDQRRQLACIAHPDWLLAEDKTRGNQRLIKDGRAIPIPNGKVLARFLQDMAPAVSGESLEEPDDADEPQMSWAF